MKGKQLRKAVLLGMAMSMAVWTTGMAETNYPNGISGNGTFGEVGADVTIDANTSGVAVNNSNATQTIEGNKVTISSSENVSLGDKSGVIYVTGKASTGVNAQNGIEVSFTGQGPNANNTAYGVRTNGLNANTEFTTANGDVTITGGSAETALVNTNFSALRGNVKITAENGDINLSSYIDDNNDSAYLRSTGIHAYGSTSNIELASQNLNITTDAQSGIASGLYSQTNNGRVDANIEKDIIISANGEGAKGIDFSYGTNTISLQAGNDLSITATSENTVTTSDKDAWSDNYGAYGVQTQYNNMNLHAGNDLTISASAVDQNFAEGIWIGSQPQDEYESGAVNEFTADGHVAIHADLDIISFAKHSGTAAGIYLMGDGAKPQDTKVLGDSVAITAESTSALAEKTVNSYGIYATTTPVEVKTKEGTAAEGADPTIVIGAKTTGGNAYSGATGIYAYNSHDQLNKVTIENNNGTTSIYGVGDGNILGIGVYMTTLNQSGDNVVDITSKQGTQIYGSESAVTMHEAQSQMTVASLEGDNSYQSEHGTAVGVNNGADFITEAKGHMNSIYSEQGTGVIASNAATAKMLGDVNHVSGGKEGIVSSHTSMVTLTAEIDNIINAGDITTITNFGTNYGIDARNGSTITLDAGNQNAVLGAVYANGTETTVQVSGLADENGNYGNSRYNYVGSAAVIAKAGGLDEDKDPNPETSFKDKKIISALYAEDGATIVVSGERNEFRSYAADPGDTRTLERTVWAYDGANIEINGSTLISTDRYDETLTAQQGNSADIAIAAGTAVNLTNDQVLANADSTSKVTLNYGAGSSITGDILSAYAGQVDIQAQDSSDAGISVKGNILAGNNGVLNIDLGKGGYLEGRADDYGDAGLNTTGEDNIDQGHATHEFFNPAFSSTIFKGGEVNLSMGEGSRWNVTGQSWVTRINTESAALADDVLAAENPVEAMNHMATIDLVEANTDRNTNAHALTVYEMTGDAVFNMSLDADRDVSDMLYMKSANGDYIINVVDAVTLDDMYAEGFDGLRFATVGEGSNVSFRAVTVGQGVFNVEYEVGTDAYANNDENHAYNGGESVSEDKPGSDLVDGFFESTQEPGTAETQASRKRMRMAAMAMPAAANDGVMLLDDTAAADDTAAVDGSVDETTNFKLIGRKDESTSNAGKTIIAMSKVNYSNAVYMDRLNKRMGEARYIDGDEGLWVRMRHDRIGKSDAFRSKNTMFELGYDRKVGDREDGEHRQGVVFDYMRGTADYHNVAGEGDVRRGGVWFYDTWLGNKGHYTDYVLKFGRLSNDFDIYSELGEKITGDYSNFVYSASAEYGRKKSLGGDWYIEPQAQLQYAHVTDADYTTSQGTSVQLDAIDSLIGRVGFRLGKDVSDTSTFYIKADVLHEFLGDQDISAFDDTGRLNTTYENEGTWYDVGLGFSHQFSKGTYMFLDVEKTFGNDNEDTYQFNVGMNWKV